MKYILMRIGKRVHEKTIYFDLYNPMLKKNVEIHYSCYCRKYSCEKINIVFDNIRRKSTPISINEIDELIEGCVIE
jgi:hypothetical protein